MKSLLIEIIKEVFLENRINDVMSDYPNHAREINNLSKLINPKYLMWAIKTIEKENNIFLSIRDIENYAMTINQFEEQVKNKRHSGFYDINRYENLGELEGKVKESELLGSKRQNRKMKRKAGSVLIGSTDLYNIFFIASPEAAEQYGKGTKWCISGNYKNSHFVNYIFEPIGIQPSELYIAIPNTQVNHPFRKIAVIINPRVKKSYPYWVYDEIDNRIDYQDLDGEISNEIKNIIQLCQNYDTSSYLSSQAKNTNPLVRAQAAHWVDDNTRIEMLKNEIHPLTIKSILTRLDTLTLEDIRDKPNTYFSETFDDYQSVIGFINKIISKGS